MTSQKELLDALLEDVAATRGSIVVFDLDDTLFSTADRHLRILAEFAARIETQDARAAGIVRAISREKLLYSVSDTAKAHGLDDMLAKDLRDFWFARFFQNRYLLEDSAVPGGPAYCAEVAARGGKVVYVTGRDERMREGTETSFIQRGFPKPDGASVHLRLKPRFDTPDLAFKTEILASLKEMGTVVASFENEPLHINLFRDYFPKARHFLLETKHSGRPVIPHDDVLRIKDFRR